MARKYATLDEAVETGEGTERPFRCPVHDDTNASASVNVVKGVWYCFSCGAKGRVDRKGSTLTTEMRAAVDALVQDEEINYPASWLDWFDKSAPHPYWVRRFGLRVSRHYRLGTHPVTLFPTYPFHDRHGRLRGVVQRTGGTPKYLYPGGVSAARSLFNWSHASGRMPEVVVVTEGACDAIAVQTALDNEVSTPFSTVAVGCYGAGLHLPQVELINAIRPRLVLLGFDNDDAGTRAKQRRYPLESQVRRISWARKDPGECSGDEIVAAVNSASHAR